MSKSQFRVARRVVSTLTATATAVTMLGSAAFGLAVAPADFGLVEGDTISAHAQTGDPDVYIVNEEGYKRLFVNPQIFNLYGHLGFDKVKAVSAATRDAFPTSGLFRNCESGDQRVFGIEVVSEDVANLRWVNTSGEQAVADDADFFKKVFCINNAEQALYGSGPDFNSVNDVPDYARGVSNGLTGPFGASFVGPAAAVYLEEQGLADIAEFSITGSGLVTNMTFARTGLSGDPVFSNAFLFVGGLRVSDGLTFSNNALTFNNPAGFFNAPVVVKVRANIANGQSGKTVGLALNMVNDTTVSASGNNHSIAAESGDLSDVTINSATGGGSLDPQTEVTLWQGDLTAGSNPVWLKRLSLRLLGSAKGADFVNLKFFIDGVEVTSAASLDADEYVHFLANHQITTSAAGILKVTGDIVGGAGRTYRFQLKGNYDLELVDGDFNAGIVPGGTYPFGPAEGTIGAASLTIVKATDSPSGDVVDSTDDFILGAWSVTAYGEAIKIETMTFQASISDTGVPSLRDGRVLIGGVQYGSTKVLTETNVEFTVNKTLQPGETAAIELRADAADGDGGTDLGSGDTVSGIFITGSSNAEGLSSGDTLNAPSSDLESNNRSIVTGTITLAKDNSYANQTIVPPTGSMKLGDYNLTGSNTEQTTLTNINVDINELSGTTGAGELRDMFVKYGTKQSTIRSTVAATQDFSINHLLGINEVLPIEVWAQVLSTASTSGHTFDTDLEVDGTTLNSGTTADTSEATGQTMTVGAGSFTAARDTNVAKNDYIVGDEQTVTAVGFEFTAVNDTYKISVLNLDIPDETGITEVRIMDGTTLVQSLPATTDMTFNIPAVDQPVVLPSAIKRLTVDLVLATIASPGGGASGVNHRVTLDESASKTIAQSSGTEAVMTGGDVVGKNLYTYKAVPTLTRLALPNSVLSAGTKTIAKFNVGNGGTGIIGWSKIILNWTGSDTVASLTMTGIAFYDALDESTVLTGVVASDSTTITFTSADELPAGDYVVKATIVDATTATNDTIVVTWQSSGAAHAAPAASASVGTANFVWTDRFSLPHTDLTPDWNNDNLVKNLPLDSWNLVE